MWKAGSIGLWSSRLERPAKEQAQEEPIDERGCHNASGQGGENVCYGPEDLPGSPNDWSPDNIVPRLEAPRISVDFTKCLGRATSEDDHISADGYTLIFLESVNEPDPEATYNSICAALRPRFPDSETLSYEQAKRKIAELTGVIPVMTDMTHVPTN
ncbi:hypothetical protein EDB89DRAFT_1902893 [Lactarius sanguifluus]|nr:hypothetical protein EDB89DRAFT_1902893 [Lactarius sanguifluus]